MNVFYRLAALTGLACLPLQAPALEFSFAPATGVSTPAGWGNSYRATLEGLTLTASAWSTTGKHSAFETAALGTYAESGLGVCNRNEGVQCVDNKFAHALDNKGADDLILFGFSSAVRLGALSLVQFNGDSDLSLWAGSGIPSLAGSLPAGLGAATLALTSSSAHTLRTVALDSTFTGSYDWLAVSARLTQGDDFAMLRALTVQPVSAPVPEIETWTMLLAGLGLVWFAVHRRS